mmetsp:Transcript_4750/g.6401  ORF Transcript_4750/g.6401 Transcript_4750/m.6401 type:complete len:439 (+) Transcript_4750:444-1760(+)
MSAPKTSGETKDGDRDSFGGDVSRPNELGEKEVEGATSFVKRSASTTPPNVPLFHQQRGAFFPPVPSLYGYPTPPNSHLSPESSLGMPQSSGSDFSLHQYGSLRFQNGCSVPPLMMASSSSVVHTHSPNNVYPPSTHTSSPFDQYANYHGAPTNSTYSHGGYTIPPYYDPMMNLGGQYMPIEQQPCFSNRFGNFRLNPRHSRGASSNNYLSHEASIEGTYPRTDTHLYNPEEPYAHEHYSGEGSGTPGTYSNGYHPNDYPYLPFKGRNYPYHIPYFQNPGPPIVRDAGKGPEGSNLFVFHIPNDFTNQDMFNLFHPYGNLLSVRIMVERETGRSRGFGFVTYDNVSSAELAIKKLDGYAIGNKRLKVQHKQRSKNDKADESVGDTSTSPTSPPASVCDDSTVTSPLQGHNENRHDTKNDSFTFDELRTSLPSINKDRK